MKEKVIVSWSGGKDSVLALYEVVKSEAYEIAALLTTVTKEYDRVSMHGVRRALAERQAEALGFVLEEVYISRNSSEQEYGSVMQEVLQRYRRKGVSGVVFGDIFLEDVRRRREDNLSKIGMRAIFPLWHRSTVELAHIFVSMGFRAVVTCVDTSVLEERFGGRVFDRQFVSELPPGIDRCGENGEFHCFVYDGPIFRRPVSHKRGKAVLRDRRFYYCDLTPDGD